MMKKNSNRKDFAFENEGILVGGNGLPLVLSNNSNDRKNKKTTVEQICQALSLEQHADHLEKAFGVRVVFEQGETKLYSILGNNSIEAQTHIGSIIHDFYDYMPEVLGLYGKAEDAIEYINTVWSVLSYGASLVGGKIATGQLEHLSKAQHKGNMDAIQPIPAKYDGYYNALTQTLGYRGSKLLGKDDNEIRLLWKKDCPETPFPYLLTDVKKEIDTDVIDKRGLATAGGTTGLHVHGSGDTITETFDGLLDLFYKEGELRYQYGEEYYKHMGKSKIRHVSFGAVVGLRYWITQKSKKYIKDKHSEHVGAHDIPKEIREEMLEENLLPPKLWVNAPMVSGYDPLSSLACRIHDVVQTAQQEEKSFDNIRDDLIFIMIKQHFPNDDDAKRVFQAYKKGDKELPEGVSLSKTHTDVALKCPGKVPTGELRSFDSKIENAPKAVIFMKEAEGSIANAFLVPAIANGT